MKAKILAGAVVALTYGTVALAEDCPPKQDAQAQLSQPQSDNLGADVGVSSDLQQDDAAIGGSGQVGMESQGLQSDAAIGGSGQGEVLLRCTPANSAAIGGSGVSAAPLAPSDNSMAFSDDKYKEKDDKEATGGSGLQEENKHDMKGLTVMLGGGVEGYTNALAPQLNPGPAASVTAAIKPTSVLGLELGYTGSALNIDNGVAGGARGGPDIIRQGGQAVATFGLMASNVQPYVLGGIGVSRYNVRAGFAQGFDDDTVGQVPVGAGLRTHIGDFTADARLNYNFLFDQEFASGVPATGVGAPGDSDFSQGGSYLGTVNIGLTF
jgi:hypothetical protein